MGWTDWADTVTNAMIGGKATDGSVSTGILGSNWFQNLAGAVSTGYDIYQGIQKQKASDRMYDLMYGTAANQDIWANLVKDRYVNTYWPYESTQYEYASADRTAMRDSDLVARDYNISRKYEQVQQAQSINPELDTAERSLIDILVEPVTNLRTRLANDAITSVNQSFDSTRLQDLRRLNVLGVNPSSGARLIYNRSLATAQALASATARNNAAIIAEDVGISRQGQALAYRAGIPLPTYQTTPSVQAGNVTTALSSTGSMAGAIGAQLDNSAQQSFTGAATALNSMYMRPFVDRYMNKISGNKG
jgi:hypothetical protein